MRGRGAVSVHLLPFEGKTGGYVKATVCGTASGRYRSELVVILPHEGPLPEDPEELIAMALSAVSAAVYHS